MTPTLAALRVANVALAAALLAKAHVPGDLPEDHEDNTYGLPGGAPIRRTLRRFFREQLQRMVGFVGKLGAEIPAVFPSLADYNDPMASAMTPILGAYWDKAGKALNGRLGLDPDEWRVTDPNLHRAIARQSFKFCAATNATTTLKLNDALAKLRQEFHEGLVERGDTIPQLTRRVQGVFANASKHRAAMIAQTEASRAVHDASEMSAIASGVVSAKRILLSANSCPLCVRIAAEARAVPLGGSFGVVGHSAEYSDVRMPPIHPHCRCSVSYDLIDINESIPAFVPGKPDPGKPETMAGEGGLAEGVAFTRTPAQARRKDVLVLADVARLDASLASDPGGFHVGPGGLGESAVPGRYAEARRFLERARSEGIAVHATEASLGPDGQAYLDDGRHRFAVLRDSGATAVPVAVGRGQAARFRKLYGASVAEAPAHAPLRSPTSEVPAAPAILPPKPRKPTKPRSFADAGSAGPILPDRPIGERVAAYGKATGNKKLKALESAILDAAPQAARNKAEYDKLWAEYRKVNDDLQYPRSEAEYQADRPRLDALRARHREMSNGLRAIEARGLTEQEAAREAVRRTLAVDRPIPIAAGHVSPDSAVSKTYGLKSPDAGLDAEVRRGLNWVGDIVRTDGREKFDVDFGQFEKDGRAFHISFANVVALDKYDGAKTVVHELGHSLENNFLADPHADRVGATREKPVRRFLEHRVGDEKLSSFKDVVDKAYARSEKGRKDRFDQAFGESGWYVGKDYPNASEILSMGLEKLHDDPLTLIRKDPEYAHFLMGILDGSLR